MHLNLSRILSEGQMSGTFSWLYLARYPVHDAALICLIFSRYYCTGIPVRICKHASIIMFRFITDMRTDCIRRNHTLGANRQGHLRTRHNSCPNHEHVGIFIRLNNIVTNNSGRKVISLSCIKSAYNVCLCY